MESTSLSAVPLYLVSILFSGQMAVAQVTPNAGPGVFSTNQALTFYVDATNGNDSNVQTACSAPTTGACKTIQAAINLVPRAIRNPVTINVAAGTYSAGAYLSGFTFDVGDQPVNATSGPYLRIVGTPVSVTPTTGEGSGTVTSATLGGWAGAGTPGPSNWGTVTVSGAGWTAHDLKGKLFKITGGTGSGQVVRIYDNTATVITLVGNFPKAIIPDTTSTFQLQTATGGTIVNGILPRPPGATGYSYSATAGASFWISGMDLTGYTGTGSGSFPGSSGITDPPISIDYFDFELAGGQVAMTLTQDTHAAARFSTFSGMQYGVTSKGRLWFESNYCLTPQDSCVSFFGDYTSASSGGGFSRVFGNYVTSSGGPGSNSFVKSDAGATVLVLQNHADSLGHAIYFGLGAHILSAGNDWASTVGAAVYAGWGYPDNSVATTLLVDGDACNSSVICYDVRWGGFIEFQNDAITGSGNPTGILANYGAQVVFNAAGLYSLTTTSTDLTIDGVNYSYTQLTGTGSLFSPSSGTRIWLDTPAHQSTIMQQRVYCPCTFSTSTTCTASCTSVLSGSSFECTAVGSTAVSLTVTAVTAGTGFTLTASGSNSDTANCWINN